MADTAFDSAPSRVLFAVSATAAALMVYTAIFSFAQGQRGAILEGTIVSMNSNSITLAVEDGRREEISRSPSTSFVREKTIGAGELVAGNAVRVLGRRAEGQNAVDAEMVLVGEIEMAGGGQPPRGPEGRVGSMRGPPTGRGDGEGREKPAAGTILTVSPLVIQDPSGSRITVRVSDRTRYIRESAANASDLREGMSVKVVAPPGPGGERPEARKVIIADRPNPQPARRDGRDDSRRATSNESSLSLQPDLPQQPLTPDFIYGVWIGRGLFSNEELDRAFRLASNLGARYVKVEVKWDYVQQEKNRFRWNDESTLDVDHVIALARKYRVSIVPYFDMDMPWAEKRNVGPDQGTCEGPPSRRGQYQAPDPQSYADYVFSVVERFRKGGVDLRFVELDNETSFGTDGYTSWNCFHNISARQLKEAHNAAFEKIKRTYPDVMISSTTFMFPGMHLGPGKNVVERDVLRRNSYIRAYFGESPKPKFDFLGIHEVISGSGNPFTSWENPVAAGARYNFGSYHDAYSMWRTILDTYGYKNVPMFNLESEAVLDGLQDAEMIQRVVFARANASRNNIRGWILSSLTPTRKFSMRSRKGMRIGIADLAYGYDLREGYAGFYAIMNILARYPRYKGKVMGTLNGPGAWVESFEDEKGRILHVAFLPFLYGNPPKAASETISLSIGPNVQARMTRSDLSVSVQKSGTDGRVQVNVTHHPVFVEPLK